MGTYAAVEREEAVGFGDVHHHLQHVLAWAVGFLGLEADLLGGEIRGRIGRFTVQGTLTTTSISFYSECILYHYSPRSKGCVTHAAKQLALPPNQNG